jgi:hypothetical protein
MYEVNVNGYKWFADTQAKILYEDKEKTKGTPFSFLTKNELEQVEREIRFPRPKTSED